MKPTYRITEYGSFVATDSIYGYTKLPQKTFNELKQFILMNKDKADDALEIMGISYKKGVGEVITAKNYVGIITMKDGTNIEILPKVCHHTGDNSEENTKKLLVRMLKTLKKSPYKNIQTTNVNIEKMNIFEIFIRMFIEEVFMIVKHGLKCAYTTVESNENSFKGKLLFTKQIKYNFAHKERSYVEYDVFETDRPENRLLKSTLLLLFTQTKLSRNKTDIKTLLNIFADVPESVNYTNDFSKCVSDRNTKDYAKALIWSRIFLEGKSFSSFAGSDIAYALLFPMETLFESYIANVIKKVLSADEYEVSTQDRTYYLFNKPNEIFSLRPDIVITKRPDGRVYVMDTKWKLLSDDVANYGISQSDMYQMYAYQKKYSSEDVTLIYPLTDMISEPENIEFISDDGVVVKVKFVDLFNVDNSLREILIME